MKKEDPKVVRSYIRSSKAYYANNLDESELKFLKDKYLHDPFIIKTKVQINGIYLQAIPIGIGKDILIYSDEVNKKVKALESGLHNYIQMFYSKLL